MINKILMKLECCNPNFPEVEIMRNKIDFWPPKILIPIKKKKCWDK